MSKKNLPHLSRTESEILAILWKLGQAPVKAVVDALPASRPMAYSTVQTLLTRLEAKGYIRHTLLGKAYVYVPAAKKEDVLTSTVRDFLKRIFADDASSLVLYLARHGDITKKDIDRLSKLLEKESERQ